MNKPTINPSVWKVVSYILAMEALVALTAWQLNQIHAWECLKTAAMRLLGLSVD